MSKVNSDDLQLVLDGVQDWPVTGEELVTKAQKSGAPEPVVEFFEAIPADEMFNSQSELLNMAEQIDTTDTTTGEAGTAEAETLPYEDDTL